MASSLQFTRKKLVRIECLVEIREYEWLKTSLRTTTSKNELKPSNSREFNHSLKRIIAQFAVEGRVNPSGVQIPSETGGHGNTSVLELGLPVIFHGGIRFAGGEAEGIKESDGRGDAHLVVDPGIEFGLCWADRFGGGKGGAGICGSFGLRVSVSDELTKTARNNEKIQNAV